MPLPPDQEHGATAHCAASTTAPAVDESSDERNKARLAILELANMISVPMALNAAVRLNVADAIWSGGANAPLTADQILSRIVLPAGGGSVASANPDNLQRVLRMLSSYGVYSLTEVGKTLVTDGDGLSYGAYVLQHHQEALMRAWPLVHTAVLNPSAEPFTRANGEPAYSYYGKDDEMNELMQRAMAGVSVPFMRAVLGSGYDGFDGVGTLVDVGGSAGDCLKMILQKHSDIKQAINFDLPEVVARAPQIPGKNLPHKFKKSLAVDDDDYAEIVWTSITHVGGDMFKSIPHADAIFMKWVITTWTDDEVQQIMKTCYDALPKGGKLIACEPVLPEQSDESHRTRALLEGDIFVMTIYRANGKHRTEEEYKTLGKSSGFTQFRAVYIDYFWTLLEFKK
ncbi:hypothetical protein V2J09_012103 [Rumex salicifolius]